MTAKTDLASPRLHRDSAGLHLHTASYRLSWTPDRPFVRLADQDGHIYTDLFLAPSLHTTGCMDGTARLLGPHVTQDDATVTLRFTLEGGAWREKTLTFSCDATGIDVTADVHGDGALTDVHLFGGYYSGHTRFGSGFFPSGAYFERVFNPEPWKKEHRTHPQAQSTCIDVMGTSLPGKAHWFFTPAPFVYAFQLGDPDSWTRSAGKGADQGGTPAEAQGAPVPEANTDKRWLSAAVVAPVSELNFTAFHYDASENAFSLRFTYEGQTRVTGHFRTPTVRLGFANDPYEAISASTRRHEELGLVQLDPGTQPDWWSTPIQCGWGAQCHLGNVRGSRATDQCTQANYDDFLGVLDAQRLKPGILVLDDKWSATYGHSEVDRDKWPDLEGWIERAHARGQRVLLWWKAWDAEGLPPEACVTDELGQAVTADPTSPVYENILRASVRRMLLEYGADGFKVDFSARTPSGPNLRRHGDAWGTHLLHRLLWILRDEAKRCKPDALVMTHSPNVVFANATDMIRLNDVNTDADVLEQMRHRARVARAALPHHLIDTDNWPMPSIQAWREYTAIQPELGIPSMYFATHVDAAGEAYTDADYDLVRNTWAAYAARRRTS